MANRDRLVETLVNLIKIDSPTGEEDEMDREVSSRLQDLGFDVRHDAYKNVIARLDGVGEPLILSAHLDTVEPGRGIRPQLDGDVLRSDGSTILGGDCKAGVAIVLEALTSTVESGSPHLPVEVIFSRAEEGGLNGAHNLDFSLITARRGVVFDGRRPGQPADRGGPFPERGQGRDYRPGFPRRPSSRRRAFPPWSLPATCSPACPWAASTRKPPPTSATWRAA